MRTGNGVRPGTVGSASVPAFGDSGFRAAAAASTGGALSTGYRTYPAHTTPTTTGRPTPASEVPPALRGPEKPDEGDTKDEKKGFLGISGGQVIAGAMAASTSAVAASYLGVAGTVLGAGLGSVIATVSTAVYQKSIQRSSKVLQTVVTTSVGGQQVPVDEVLHEGRDSSTVAPDPSLPGVEQVGRGLPDPNRAETHVMGAVPDEATRPFGVPPLQPGPLYGSASVPPPSRPGDSGTVYGGPAWYSELPWKRIALTSAALFVLVMGVITTIEVIEGRTVADAVNGRQGDGTTLNHVVTGGGDNTAPTTSPTPSESGSPSESATTSESPSESVSPSTEGSESPSGEPSAPSDPTQSEAPNDDQSSPEPNPIQTQGTDQSSPAPVAPMTDAATTVPSASPLV
ncbi:hypothetical protein GCM10009539_32510 [Cryptosporangium japonicum]|uniref:Uncharacterized protein n=1 Tax=Cryptosporangium japonicum TaxID=80872 RepID=A0ABN0UAZ1_9ACTN